VGIRERRARIAGVAEPIAVLVGLIRVGDGRAVVLSIDDTVEIVIRVRTVDRAGDPVESDATAADDTDQHAQPHDPRVTEC
jgi:hypothetical protein